MFTGIIETVATVTHIVKEQGNISFTLQSSLSHLFKIDQSISHDGVCLTVVQVSNGSHTVTAIEETLNKTNLQHWTNGKLVNIERCMLMNGRLDGHIVQGHVDTVAKCKFVTDKNGSWEYTFEFDEKFAALTIEKGSISINGTSLTLYNVTNSSFSVAIIPYTYENTSISQVKMGDLVNIEFDIIGKYIQKLHAISK